MTRLIAVLGLAIGLLGWTACGDQTSTGQPSVDSGEKAPAAMAGEAATESAAETEAEAPTPAEE
jgi:hypothetical protein